MALRDMQIVLAFALLTSMWAAAMAQSTSGCTTVLISLSPCLNYITGNDSTPSSTCCSQLASVVQSQPQCLCQVLDGGSSLGININKTQALALPSACNVQTPPASRCNAAGGATAPSQTPAAPTTPVSPPSDSTPSTPSTPTSPTTPAAPAVPTAASGSGSKSTGSNSSDAKSITVSLSLISSLLFISAYAF